MQPTSGTVPGAMSENGHRERTFTWQDPMSVATLGRERSGMEVLQAVIDGEVGAPPIADLLGMTLVEIGEGRAVFAPLGLEDWVPAMTMRPPAVM